MRLPFPRASLRTRTFLAATSVAGLVVVASCGADESKTKSCVLSFSKESDKVGGSTVEVTYRAPFSNECKQVYSENTGRAVVTLRVTAKKTEGMYVRDMVAGSRSASYGEKNGSLAQGALESSFGSDFQTSWAFPWPDQPGTASVTVIVPKDVERENWPSVMTAEFAAAGT